MNGRRNTSATFATCGPIVGRDRSRGVPNRGGQQSPELTRVIAAAAGRPLPDQPRGHRIPVMRALARLEAALADNLKLVDWEFGEEAYPAIKAARRDVVNARNAVQREELKRLNP